MLVQFDLLHMRNLLHRECLVKGGVLKTEVPSDFHLKVLKHCVWTLLQAAHYAFSSSLSDTGRLLQYPMLTELLELELKTKIRGAPNLDGSLADSCAYSK